MKNTVSAHTPLIFWCTRFAGQNVRTVRSHERRAQVVRPDVRDASAGRGHGRDEVRAERRRAGSQSYHGGRWPAVLFADGQRQERGSTRPVRGAARPVSGRKPAEKVSDRPRQCCREHG